jgi:acetoin utilization deacetylase AcuC-like enzyme/formylglycine-generating enzyme required for sulfatase activity
LNARHERGTAAADFCCLALIAFSTASCRRAEEASPAAEQPAIITTAGGVQMVLIPAGSFRMGSSSGPPDQQPVHEVALDSFLMDRYEVTQEQYTQLASLNGSHFKGPNRPVEMISWADAALYCNLRSQAEGLTPCYNEETVACNFEADGYRLPTEAEWEYACRAGAVGEYALGSAAAALKDHAWYGANAGKQTHPVGQKQPQAWGLYDMHGNVAEWCNDVYAADYYQHSPAQNPRGPQTGDKYVLRGGAWNSSAEACRTAQRVGETPGFQDSCFARDAIGFRCVRKAPRQPEQEARTREREAKESNRATMLAQGVGWAVPTTHRQSWWAQPTLRSFHSLSAWEPALLTLCVADAESVGTGNKTGFVYGDIYLQHQTGAGHPEKPERLTAIVQRLKKSGLLAELIAIEPRPAAEAWLTAVHTPEHVAAIRQAAEGVPSESVSRDTPTSKQSYAAAVHAAGGVLAAIDAVMAGQIRNAFCAVRPPGHHATQDRAMGFCLFNNVAIAARYIQKKHHLAKVLIVDWDVHHGNGTQAIFDDDPSVFYFSVHQSPFYPGTGHADQRGRGKAQGTKLNVPLPAGSNDRDYRRAFEEQLVPAAREFQPDFVLISAGFDAHEHDLLGGMKLTTAAYAELTRMVRQIAEQNCQGRLVSVLEGGYGLEGLAASVESHLRVLLENPR